MTSPFKRLYQLAEILAVLAMFLILLLVGGGIALRAVGMQLAGSDDLAGYCLVAIFFLALGPTYRRSEHIRVGLLIDRLHTRAKTPLEFMLSLLATAGAGWATWWLGRYVYDSYRFGDVAGGLLPVPLWIPQLSMFVGAFVLLIALLEDLVRFTRGLEPSYLEAKDNIIGDEPHFER
jgi:TRAP-type C4-dicarboxylate transport system permease small subunit